ncbi:MAG: TetR/AcrR family transcriptional regulator [Bacteroidota bacterium]
MGTAERREKEKELKKASMLEAAESLIIEKGLEALHMDEVAERAEVSKGSLYQYFKNKSELTLGICVKSTELLRDALAKVITLDVSGMKMVHMMGLTYMRFVVDHPEYFNAMRFFDQLNDTNISVDNEYVIASNKNTHSIFSYTVRAIQIGMQDGSINDKYDPKELAMLIWSSCHGLVSMAYLNKTNDKYTILTELGFQMEELVDGFMKLIGFGIATEQSGLVIDFESFIEIKGS